MASVVFAGLGESTGAGGSGRRPMLASSRYSALSRGGTAGGSGHGAGWGSQAV